MSNFLRYNPKNRKKAIRTLGINIETTRVTLFHVLEAMFMQDEEKLGVQQGGNGHLAKTEEKLDKYSYCSKLIIEGQNGILGNFLLLGHASL